MKGRKMMPIRDHYRQVNKDTNRDNIDEAIIS